MYSKIEFGFVFYRDSKEEEEEKKITFDEACFASFVISLPPFLLKIKSFPDIDDAVKCQRN